VTWDDNWTRALVTIAAATLGAILASFVNAYASRQKIREIELQYQYKLRDGYLENARKLVGEVYIPINIALTYLFNSYERYAANTDQNLSSDASHNEFKAAAIKYIETIDELLRRGADAYLIGTIDEQLNSFTNFIRNSVQSNSISKKIVLQAHVPLIIPFTKNAITTNFEREVDDKTYLGRTKIPSISLSFGGISFSYSEKILAAPFQSIEFQARIRSEVPQIKFQIKEVTLGSHPSNA
jgi:hypothetical protein